MGLFSSLKALAGDKPIDYDSYTVGCQNAFRICEDLKDESYNTVENKSGEIVKCLYRDSVEEMNSKELRNSVSLQDYLKENSADMRGIIRIIKFTADHCCDVGFNFLNPIDNNGNTFYNAFVILQTLTKVASTTDAEYFYMWSPYANSYKYVHVGNIYCDKLQQDVKQILNALANEDCFDDVVHKLLREEATRNDSLIGTLR